jgi:hypothetical protein
VARLLPITLIGGFQFIAAGARTGIFDPERPSLRFSMRANRQFKAAL